ncbi:hypothetical protein H4S08_003640 [Coemansia sp. RSA 1365]|nr:hypothetical protein H4S08_003640 [Coemansia sp. RSA 1365]
MTLITLMDDVAGELTYRVFNSASKPTHVGFTVNLNIRRNGTSPEARIFFFSAAVVTVSGRKIVVECLLFDGMSGIQLMTASIVFVFVPTAGIFLPSDIPESSNVNAGSKLPALNNSATRYLSVEELGNLSQVMNFLPRGLIAHTSGWVGPQKGQFAVLLNFGKDMCGPPNHVHGGVLATVLNNASVFLFSSVTGATSHSAIVLERDISYRKGMPIESQNAFIDAAVESTSSDQIVIVSQLLRNTQLCTTLRTTFLLPKNRSSKL